MTLGRPRRGDVDARRLQGAMVLLHFDVAHWWPLLTRADAGILTAPEIALLERVDRRAFCADAERIPRTAAALVDEFPVTVAVVGVPRLFELFRSPSMFVVIEDAPLFLALPSFLDGHPLARIECAIAAARRRRRSGGPLTRAPGVEAVGGLPDGSVAAWTALRAQLGADPTREVLAGKRLRWTLPVTSAVTGGFTGDVTADGALEGLIVDHGLVDPRVGRCTSPLGRILSELRSRPAGVFDDDARARLRDLGRDGPLGASPGAPPRAPLDGDDDVLGLCCAFGCDDDDEARALLADLVQDGLLAGPEPVSRSSSPAG